MRFARHSARAFALYEVLLGMAIFTVGVIVLGRSVGNCLKANALGWEEDRVRQILSNRMAEIQVTNGFPDEQKETRIDTGYGEVRLIQRSAASGLTDDKNLEMSGIKRVTLTAEWNRGNQTQSKKIEFYVNRR